MNQPTRLVIAGLVGGLIVFIAGAAWIATHGISGDPDTQSRGQFAESLLQTRGLVGAQSSQIDFIFKRLDALEDAQSKTNDETIDDRIQAAVDNAVAEAGVDKAGLTDRVRAIIREIAKQSAQEGGRAEQRAPQRPATRQGAASIGQPVSGVSSVNADTDHILGKPDAPVSLIVYDDFECPFCKRHHPTLKKIADRFEGRANVVFRHLPLGMHNPVAKQEALISECVARQGGNPAFWRYADGVFARTGGNGRGLTTTGMDSLLESLDLDAQSVRDCVADNRDALLSRINDNVTEAQRLGVRGTPGNVLIHNDSGEALRINGARPLAQFVPAINAFLQDQ